MEAVGRRVGSGLVQRKIYVFGPKFSVFWPESVAQIIPILAQISYYFGPNHCVFGPKYYVFGPNYYVFGTFFT